MFCDLRLVLCRWVTNGPSLTTFDDTLKGARKNMKHGMITTILITVKIYVYSYTGYIDTFMPMKNYCGYVLILYTFINWLCLLLHFMYIHALWAFM